MKYRYYNILRIWCKMCCKKPETLSFKRHLSVLCIGLACCLLSGCLSTKSITYFNYFQPTNPEIDELVTNMKAAYTPIIKPGDILSITVSSMDKDDREIFNPFPSTISQQAQFGGFVVIQPIRGFKVDTLGEIQFPQIGAVKVSGLTTKDVEQKLTDQLVPYVKSLTVYVNIANFTISVLGEVARPAQYVITNNQITLPEAIAIAGDLTIYGKRNNIMIIREMEGQRIFGRVDLTNRDLFRSPYYYLRSGDLIYVEPTKAKITSTDRTYQLTPIVLGTMTLILMIINSFK